MHENNNKRGFVTIATGSDKYYQLAQDLLRSYRRVASDRLPFAIICDRVCAQTSDFDDVVVLEKANCSYLDKLDLYRNSPYEETIFVDADAFFLKDPKKLWDDFSLMGDFCGYGKPLPLESKNGWFDYNQTGKFQKYIRFGVQMHGGLYYFRKTDGCREIFERAKYLAEHYSEYRFAHFIDPADEPVLALSMAISGCEPCNKEGRVVFVPSYEGRLKVTREGQLLIDKKDSSATIVHFGTVNTRRFVYRYLQALVESSYCKEQYSLPKSLYWNLKLNCLWLDIKIPMMRRLKRFIKYSVSQKTFQKLRSLKK